MTQGLGLPLMTLPARAAALAAELSRTRIITPTLTDDAATLTVTLDATAILAALEETRREAIEEVTRLAEDLLRGRPRHWHKIAAASRALIDAPDSKRPASLATDGSDAS